MYLYCVTHCVELVVVGVANNSIFDPLILTANEPVDPTKNACPYIL